MFTALIAHGVTVVATSDRPPADLYKDGLNREHFLPFIALIEERLDVMGLNGPTDYRRYRLGDGKRWFVPTDAAATEALSAAFFRPDRLSARTARMCPRSIWTSAAGGRCMCPRR